MTATLKLLLDEHVWPGLAGRLREALPGAHIESLHHWMEGRFLHQPDESILSEAHAQEMTLVTFDLATIPALLADRIALGEDHAGVIFVSTKSFAQNDHGGLLRAIIQCWPAWSATPWLNRVEFLRRR
jgi:predicted nuclease of predicted toxin-antitoxin system